MGGSVISEGGLTRWRRRALTIPTTLLSLVIYMALFPLLFVAGLLHGLFTGSRFSALRLLLFGGVFLSWEVLGLFFAFALWLALGWWRAPGYIAANHRLQWWWGASLGAIAAFLFRVRVKIENDAVFSGAPTLLFIRHNSFADTLIAVWLVSWRHGYRMRYVLKRELLWDPCLDVVGQRLPNAFVARAGMGAGAAVRAVAELAASLGPNDGVVIYPEGTRFSPERRARMLKTLEERWPALHAQAVQWEHVLPPRAGGPIELIDAAPEEAQIVFCGHGGLEKVMRPLDVIRGGLTGQTVQVRFWSAPKSAIPEGDEARLQWLYGQWAEMERFVASIEAPEC